ncbi:hypothetical protein, partial [Stenotrophomonas maltophilia]|uniref:hypothetical protein n=1 Tax=Stenotrophomonas maltophilia TaxID=40324 RepID=UPI001953FD16
DGAIEPPWTGLPGNGQFPAPPRERSENQKPILQTFMTSAVSTKVDTHQSRMSFQQPRETVEGGVGPVAGA